MKRFALHLAIASIKSRPCVFVFLCTHTYKFFFISSKCTKPAINYPWTLKFTLIAFERRRVAVTKNSKKIKRTMSLEERFKITADKVRNMTPPADADSLELYSLYKQAIAGDCNTAKPGVADLKGKAKWDAWNSKKGVSKDDAKEKYIAKATSLGL